MPAAFAIAVLSKAFQGCRLVVLALSALELLFDGTVVVHVFQAASLSEIAAATRQQPKWQGQRSRPTRAAATHSIFAIGLPSGCPSHPLFSNSVRNRDSPTEPLRSPIKNFAGGHEARAAGAFVPRHLSRIAQLDQRTALPDQCLHSAEADVRPSRRKSGFDLLRTLRRGCEVYGLAFSRSSSRSKC